MDTVPLFMGLNLSNAQIGQELGLDADSAHDMATQIRNGIFAKQPEVVLSGEVECDEVYIVAGHTGNPEAVKKKADKGVEGVGKVIEVVAPWRKRSLLSLG